MNKNQKIVLIIGNTILFTVILIWWPAWLNPTAHGGYSQAIAIDMPANGLRMFVSGVTLLVCIGLRDKKPTNNAK